MRHSDWESITIPVSSGSASALQALMTGLTAAEKRYLKAIEIKGHAAAFYVARDAANMSTAGETVGAYFPFYEETDWKGLKTLYVIRVSGAAMSAQVRCWYDPHIW